MIDLTRARAGPTAARHFADWGADVIKVEMPQDGDEDPMMGGSRHGPDFFNLHRNKRSMTLNLKTADGVAILKKLAGERRRADRELPARREAPARLRLRDACARSIRASST